MVDENNHLADNQLDIQATASKTGLSLKAKGAGLFVLLALAIGGIIFLGYQLTLKESDSRGLIALVFLMFIAQSLVAALLAVLGLRVVK